MFFISMPKRFKIGDTESARINGKTAQVHWKDKATLVILPDDERTILSTDVQGELRSFSCGHAGKGTKDYKRDGPLIVADF